MATATTAGTVPSRKRPNWPLVQANKRIAELEAQLRDKETSIQKLQSERRMSASDQFFLTKQIDTLLDAARGGKVVADLEKDKRYLQECNSNQARTIERLTKALTNLRDMGRKALLAPWGPTALDEATKGIDLSRDVWMAAQEALDK